MLKLMENDYVFHWSILHEPGSSNKAGYGVNCYHRGACDNILRYYAMLLDCTIDEARERMQKLIGVSDANPA